MIPTNKLRFVKRDQYTSMPQYGTNAISKDTIQVLQQWWSVGLSEVAIDPSKVKDGEWRDVPLEKEYD